MSFSSLPDEVYLEILERLPVKSIYACKYLSRSLLRIISDPSFVKSQLNLAVQKNNPSLMLGGYRMGNDTGVIHSINYDSLSSETTDDINIESERDYPFTTSGSRVKLVGSCDGLVCIRVNQNSFYIWNPTTNEYKKVPESPNVYGKIYMDKCGFGYDRETDDYKLVYVVGSGDEKGSSVEVYTLGLNSWKNVPAFPYSFEPGKGAAHIINGVLCNGALHWFGSRRDRRSSALLISLEISSEKFKQLRLPKEALEKKSWFQSVGVLDGCLCVLVKDDKVASKFEVWVMQDYGVQESWTKITTVWRFTIHNAVRLMWSLKNGKIIFLNLEGNLVLYDPEHRSVKELSSHVKFTSGAQYFESLVSPNSGNYSGIEAHVEAPNETETRKSV